MAKTHLSRFYPSHLGLLTDLYQLTMANGYWKSGMHRRRAVFHLFFRKAPFGGHCAIAAGLELAMDFLERFRFGQQDVQYLGNLRAANGQPLFEESFLNHLQRMEFNCHIDAIPEGTVVFPHQPLLRVEGPIIQCQAIESALLCLINFSTLIATKSARIVAAARGDSVLEFGMRRAQGLDGGLTASRAAYIGGCHATSSVMAGQAYGIPVKGTHAHSWVMCFDDELDAFQRYAEAMPNNCIFLVDTYDTLSGTRNAIAVARRLRSEGHEVLGIRLDSGDLAKLSQQARKLLDAAGFPDAAIVASNELDEYQIRMLKEKGAPISVWGVGTRLVTAEGQPALGGVYKLSAIQDEDNNWENRIKLSENPIKTSNPGIQQVHRLHSSEGIPIGDIIYDIRNPVPAQRAWTLSDGRPFPVNGQAGSGLLEPIIRDGKRVYSPPPLKEVRKFSLAQQALFERVGPLENYPTGIAEELHRSRNTLIGSMSADH